MKLLVRATNWLGDVAMSLPALRALRRAFPDAPIAVLARPWVAELYRLRPDVDEVIVEEPTGEHAGRAGQERLAAQLRRRAFDRTVLFPDSFRTAWMAKRAAIPERIGYRGEGRGPLLTISLAPFREPGLHQVWKHLRLAAAAGATDAASAAPDTSWAVPGAARDSARERLTEAGWKGEPFLAAHVASFAHAAKRWPLGRFAAAFDDLHDARGLSIVLLGSAGERAVNAQAASLAERARVLDLSGRSSLPEALGVLALAAGFAGNDSGLAHLAGAVGTPAAVVFGSTDPDATRPWDGPRGDGRPVRLRALRRRTACAPCRFDVCPLDHACMNGVAPGELVRALLEMLPA